MLTEQSVSASNAWVTCANVMSLMRPGDDASIDLWRTFVELAQRQAWYSACAAAVERFGVDAAEAGLGLSPASAGLLLVYLRCQLGVTVWRTISGKVRGTSWSRGDKVHQYRDWPAEMWSDGTCVWARDGKRHRGDGLPAYVVPSKVVVYYEHGACHRANGLPAVKYAAGTELYYEHGLLHRDGGLPAIVCTNNTRMWAERGALHRDGGLPAVCLANGEQFYYEHGHSVPGPGEDSDAETTGDTDADVGAVARARYGDDTEPEGSDAGPDAGAGTAEGGGEAPVACDTTSLDTEGCDHARPAEDGDGDGDGDDLGSCDDCDSDAASVDVHNAALCERMPGDDVPPDSGPDDGTCSDHSEGDDAGELGPLPRITVVHDEA